MSPWSTITADWSLNNTITCGLMTPKRKQVIKEVYRDWRPAWFQERTRKIIWAFDMHGTALEAHSLRVAGLGGRLLF